MFVGDVAITIEQASSAVADYQAHAAAVRARWGDNCYEWIPCLEAECGVVEVCFEAFPPHQPPRALRPLTSLQVEPPQLFLSTGDTNRYITVTAEPSTAAIAPRISYSADKLNSECEATLAFVRSAGVGSVQIPVTSGDVGCGVLATNVRPSAGPNVSVTTGKIIVPPQIMIKLVVGEAGGQPNDVDHQAILVTARNRFGDTEYFGGYGGAEATWQAVLLPGQFKGLLAPGLPENGPEQPLRNAGRVFAGEVGDIVGGAQCFFSPTADQWKEIQEAFTLGSTSVPVITDDPGCFPRSIRQFVIKASIGASTRGGIFQGAPAFVFVRRRQPNEPAVVQIN